LAFKLGISYSQAEPNSCKNFLAFLDAFRVYEFTSGILGSHTEFTHLQKVDEKFHSRKVGFVWVCGSLEAFIVQWNKGNVQICNVVIDVMMYEQMYLR
jgi:hypothetical protein